MCQRALLPLQTAPLGELLKMTNFHNFSFDVTISKPLTLNYEASLVSVFNKDVQSLPEIAVLAGSRRKKNKSVFVALLYQ